MKLQPIIFFFFSQHKSSTAEKPNAMSRLESDFKNTFAGVESIWGKWKPKPEQLNGMTAGQLQQWADNCRAKEDRYRSNPKANGDGFFESRAEWLMRRSEFLASAAFRLDPSIRPVSRVDSGRHLSPRYQPYKQEQTAERPPTPPPPPIPAPLPLNLGRGFSETTASESQTSEEDLYAGGTCMPLKAMAKLIKPNEPLVPYE